MTKTKLDTAGTTAAKALSPLVLFPLVFVVTLLPSLQGFDLTDHGFHISQQYFDLAASMKHSGTELYLGSEIVGHLWLNLLSFPMLAWARMGGALLHAISAAFTFLILRRYFSRGLSFWSVFLVSVWMIGASPVIIQYYTLPATVAVIYLWSIDTAQRASVPYGSHRLAWWYVLAGAMGVLLAFSRLTLAPLVVLPLVPIVIAYRRDRVHPAKSILSLVVGLAVGSLLIVLLLTGMGLLGTYLSEIFRTVSQVFAEQGGPVSSSHGFTELISRYLREYAYAAVLTGGLLFVTAGFRLVLKVDGDGQHTRRRRIIGWAILGVSLVAVVGAITLRPTLLLASWIRRIMNWSISGVLIYTAIRQLLRPRSFFRDRRLAALFVLGATVVMFSSLGSNTGITKNSYGFWVPLSILIAGLHDWIRRNVQKVQIRRALVAAGVILVGVAGFYNTWAYVYRDSPNRFELAHQPDIPTLRWTFTTKERTEWLERVAQEFESVPQDADVFFVNASPSLYYVFNRPPVVGSSWFFLPGAEAVTRNLERIVESETYPDIVFAPTFNTLSPTWPDETPIIEKYTTRMEIVQNVLLSPAGYRNVSTDPTYEFWIRE